MMSRKTKDDRTGRILRKSYWSASRRLFFFGVFLITLVIATMIGQVSYSKPDPNGGTNTNNNQNQNQGNNQNNNNQNQGGNNQNQNGGNSNGGSNGGGGGSGGGSTCGSAHTFFDWGCNGVDDKDSILTVLVTISNWLAAGVVIAVIGGIIYGAIMYATSAGDAAKAKSATEIIRNAFIALILYFLMWAFLQYIVPGGLFN
ncbi:pilin [Candidatus Nanoperiomorbus periodonticus]|uniref:pilin n=1 Tax=Candidatus Nanoperiomorbus periodonticus TaxID=2171989 RepID=UPI00101C8F33|nr:pilin [Candidatus Nanoperiomorbus periodonticus]